MHLPGEWPAFEKPVEVTSGWLSSFSDWLEAVTKYAEASKVGSKVAFELHELASSIRHRLRTQWSPGSVERSLQMVTEAYETHFGLRDAWTSWQAGCWRAPARGEVCVQLDYVEHHTLPIGPELTGEAYYANSVFWDVVSSAS